MALTKKEREVLKEKWGGRCAYCGDPLAKGWHADHIEPIRRNFKWNSEKCRYDYDGTCENPENETLDNFNPSCASCNIVKSSLPLESFRELVQGFVNSLNLYLTQYKFAKRYGLVKETDTKVEFYFEKVTRETLINNVAEKIKDNTLFPELLKQANESIKNLREIPVPHLKSGVYDNKK